MLESEVLDLLRGGVLIAKINVKLSRQDKSLMCPRIPLVILLPKLVNTI